MDHYSILKYIFKKFLPSGILSELTEYRRRQRSLGEFGNIRNLTNRHYESLAPFDKYRCIFIHIPKTAGTAIAHTLFGCSAGVHRTVRDYQKIFPPATYKKYFKFTFVRNPYDRLNSAFQFLKKGGLNQSDQEWAREHVNKYEDLDQFVRDWLSDDSVFNSIHFKPQVHYLRNELGDIDLDFIGKYENLNQDYRLISEGLRINGELDRINVTKDKDADVSLSEFSLAKIQEVYADDFDLLGYSKRDHLNFRII